MNILVIGGSGLLGTHTVREALRRGHRASILTRGAMPADASLGSEVVRLKGDVHAMSPDELGAVFAGQDAVVYSLGIDDREPHPIPAYKAFHRDHVEVCLKVLRSAKAAGVQKFVVFGSYFTWLDRTFPELRLSRRHVYIRTRLEQLQSVLAETGPGFDSHVLEIPYILGALPGKVPPWSFLFDMLAGTGRKAWFFMTGGTAAVTPRQIAEATLGAIEGAPGGRSWPMGGINVSWVQLAEKFFAAVGSGKGLKHLPRALFSAFGWVSALGLAIMGKERGLNIGHFADVQYLSAFIDPEPTMAALGFGHDDYDAALATMVREWQAARALR